MLIKSGLRMTAVMSVQFPRGNLQAGNKGKMDLGGLAPPAPRVQGECSAAARTMAPRFGAPFTKRRTELQARWDECLGKEFIIRPNSRPSHSRNRFCIPPGMQVRRRRPGKSPFLSFLLRTWSIPCISGRKLVIKSSFVPEKSGT